MIWVHKQKKMWTVACGQYREWILDPRHTMLLMLLVFIHSQIIAPMVDVAKEGHVTMNVLEPYVAMANSMLLQIAIPFIYMVLLSDFPSRFGNSLFDIVRIGRSGWLGAQVIFSGLCALTYAGFLLVATMLMTVGYGHFGGDWSAVITGIKDDMTGEVFLKGCGLLSESTYFQGRVVTVVLYTLLFMMLNLLLLNLIQIALYCVGLQRFGVFACIALEVLGAVLCGSTQYIKWVFPTANSVFGEHFTLYFRKPLFEPFDSLLYYAFLLVLLLTVSDYAIQNTALGDAPRD